MEKKQTFSNMKHYVLIRKYFFYSICSYTCFRMYIKLYFDIKYFFVIMYHVENAKPIILIMFKRKHLLHCKDWNKPVLPVCGLKASHFHIKFVHAKYFKQDWVTLQELPMMSKMLRGSQITHL